ncbi:MAG: hypothetical protein IKS43_05560 [Clostridia bacterium]|nr:hypothetical protein [Clostridia bacterium]
MFDDIENNRKMILGAYKKLKSYYYYDKTILYNKVKLASWESNQSLMNKSVDELASFMYTMNDTLDWGYLASKLRQVRLVPVPKSFIDEEDFDNGKLISNAVPSMKPIKQVNFYISAPVELLILDTIWMLMIGKIAYQGEAISSAAYANKPRVSQLYNDCEDLYEGIDFSSNRLFIPYFKQYSSWRDSAFRMLKERNDKKQDSILISLDIKSYYYSVIFKFERLQDYLNNDKRLSKISKLTAIIQHLYLEYTEELKKYHSNIPADCTKGECALPIGLHSSMLLANLYLYAFDDSIQTRMSPVYYGRYVDDILLVIDRPALKGMTIRDIIHNTLVNKGILVEKKTNKGEYYIVSGKAYTNNLVLQKDKIRCIVLDHNEPDALVNLLCKFNKIHPSMTDGTLMPEIELSKLSFSDAAYSLGEQKGALKVRSVLFSSNNYEASVFINTLIKTCKNIDTDAAEHSRFISEQLEQILRFYRANQGIEYRSAWISILSLALINKKIDCFERFFVQIKEAIGALHSKTIDNVDSLKTDYIIESIKEALIEQLHVAAAIAVAPFIIDQVKAKLQLSGEIDEYELDEIMKNAWDIRNANMFNNHYSAFPLISYLRSNELRDLSFPDADLSSLRNLPKNTNGLLSLDNWKLEFSPRFIHFDELCLLGFISGFSNGGNPNCGRISEISQIYVKINETKISMPSLEAPTDDSSSIKLEHIIVRLYNNELFSDSIKIAIASIQLDEKNDVACALDNPNSKLTQGEKQRLYHLLNEAKKWNANMVVFPEYYLPIQWFEEVFTFARKNSIAIVSGLRYITDSDRAYNYVTVIQPFNQGSFNLALPLFREKNNYAPFEEIKLAEHGFMSENPKTPSIHLIDWGGIKYSDLVCYELTNIAYRYCLRKKVDILFVPELNRDTTYFSSIVESTSRDLHCFVVQANTSKYGDSRIAAPYKTNYKDIVKVKGGENDILLVGTIRIRQLQQSRDEFPERQKKKIAEARRNRRIENNKEDDSYIKDPPAGFYD